jgi:hypothetical protein
VVRESLDALEKDQSVCVPGVIYKLLAPLMRSGLLSGVVARYPG